MEQKAKGFMRGAKNFAIYSEVQSKVREATSNDPWGPSGTQMSEIARLTFSSSAFTEIMDMIDKRLNDSGKNWRHVFKALTLLDYLLRSGHEDVAQWSRANLYIIKTLKEFQYIDDKGQDQGANVREKTKHIMSLLNSPEDLRHARANRSQFEERIRTTDQYSSAQQHRYDDYRAGNSDMRRADSFDEDAQVRKALEESKRQYEEEQRNRRRREESDVQKAIDLSQKEYKSPSPDLIAMEMPPSRQDGRRTSHMAQAHAPPQQQDYFASIEGSPPPPSSSQAAPPPSTGFDSFGFPSSVAQPPQQHYSQQVLSAAPTGASPPFGHPSQPQYHSLPHPSTVSQQNTGWQPSSAWTPAPNTNMPNPFERDGGHNALSAQPTGASVSSTKQANYDRHSLFGPSGTPFAALSNPTSSTQSSHGGFNTHFPGQWSSSGQQHAGSSKTLSDLANEQRLQQQQGGYPYAHQGGPISAMPTGASMMSNYAPSSYQQQQPQYTGQYPQQPYYQPSYPVPQQMTGGMPQQMTGGVPQQMTGGMPQQMTGGLPQQMTGIQQGGPNAQLASVLRGSAPQQGQQRHPY